MKTILLAAGLSNRMQPITSKPLLNFLGKPLVVHQVEMLLRHDLNDIVLVCGKHNIEDLKAVDYPNDANIDFALQTDNASGIQGAILSCEEFLNGEDVLILNSNDIVEDKAIANILKEYKATTHDAYITGIKQETYFPGGYLSIDANGIMTGIIEKPGAGNEPSDLVNIIVHLYRNSSELIEFLKNANSDADDLYETAMQNMIKAKKQMLAVSYNGIWQSIKFPWHVKPAFDFFFERAEKYISDSASISEHAIVKGDVIIEDGVRIFEGAIVNGPAYIGKDSIIANGSLVRDSHLGAGCIVGFATEIARSYLGHDVWTHTNYVGDSVLGNNVSFGSGTVTGNLRLDEKNIAVSIKKKKLDSGQNKLGLITGNNIRVGINTSFMPGVKIGSDCFIGAGIVIAQDIPAGSFVRGEQSLKISPNRAVASDDRSQFKKKI